MTGHGIGAAIVREADREAYLAALFAPAEKRGDLFALLAFNIEISNVIHAAKEPMAGEIRFQWWREAIGGERPEEAAGHPLARELRELVERDAGCKPSLLGMIDGYSDTLVAAPFPDRAAFDRHVQLTKAALWLLMLKVLDADVDRTTLLEAAKAFVMKDIWRTAPQDAARGRVRFPQDALTMHGFDAGGQVENCFASLHDQWRGAALGHLSAARKAKWPDAVKPVLLPLALLESDLARMQKHGGIRPIAAWRRQWLLWRAARRQIDWF